MDGSIKDFAILYLGGSGVKIAQRYLGDKDKYVISSDKDDIVYCGSQNIPCIDLSAIGENYKLSSCINKCMNFDNTFLEVIKRYKKILLVSNLGEVVGASLYICVSRLCKKNNIVCDAVISTPFGFEGRKIFNAFDALNMGFVDNMLPIPCSKLREYLTAQTMLNDSFEYLYVVFNECIKYYEEHEYIDSHDFCFYLSKAMKRAVGQED